MINPNDVLQFLQAADQYPLTNEYDGLYYRLIQEEYHELQEAVEQGDTVKELDGCLDLIWVIIGHCYMKGYDISGAWNELTRSNMDKINPETGKMDRREDGKIIKPKHWTPPNFQPFVGVL